MLGNAAGWVAYSVATTPPDIYIFLCNALGTLLGLFYTVTAISLASGGNADIVAAGSSAERQNKRTVNVIAGTALGSSALIMAAGGVQAFMKDAMSDKQHELMWGSVANLILIAFFTSPLSSLAHVLRSRCSATIFANWPLSVVSTANSALWTAYGLAIGRPFVWAPNAFGCVLGVVQLLLCALLPTRASAAASPTAASKSGSPKGGAGEEIDPRLVAVSMRVTPAARATGRVAPLEGGGGGADGGGSGLSSRSGSGSGGSGGRDLSRAWSAGQWSAAPGAPAEGSSSVGGVRLLWSRLSSSFGGGSRRGERGGNRGNNADGSSAAAGANGGSRRRLRGGEAAAARDSAGNEELDERVPVGTVEGVDVEAAARG